MTNTTDPFYPPKQPRVHIRYDVETEGAHREQELPLVLGIIGNFLGNANHNTVPLKQRDFVHIDPKKLDQTLANFEPKLQFSVENHVDTKHKNMPIELSFKQMADFEPDQLVQNIPQLKQLMDLRQQLLTLLNKCERDERVEQHVMQALKTAGQFQDDQSIPQE